MGDIEQFNLGTLSRHLTRLSQFSCQFLNGHFAIWDMKAVFALVLGLLWATNCGGQSRSAKKGRPSAKIYGGKPASEGQFPWHAAILWPKGDQMKLAYHNYRCGATVIDGQWLLTAAHCVAGYKDWAVYAGSTCLPDVQGTLDCVPGSRPGQFYNASACYVHPDYQRLPGKKLQHDLALLKINGVWPAAIKPALIPDAALEAAIAKREFSISGWGFRNSCNEKRPHGLQFATVRQDPGRCGVLSPLVNVWCAAGAGSNADTNEGDSGGPLASVYNGAAFVLGVTSAGASCDSSYRYGVYVRTAPYRTWIRNVVENRPQERKLECQNANQ